MRYGWTSEHGKADLMNIQHVLAILRPNGIGAVITPQGVLFRGGAEAEIRRGIVGDGRLEAEISLGPNVLQSTSIPACILVLRGTEGLPYERRGQVMFIDAEREMVTGRTQNGLEPEAAERSWMSSGTGRTYQAFRGQSRYRRSPITASTSAFAATSTPACPPGRRWTPAR
jgi:type I restriction enzyme M protein